MTIYGRMTCIVFVLLLLSGADSRAQSPDTVRTMTDFKAAVTDAPADDMDMAGYQALLKQGPVTVIDLRSSARFADGHITGSINVPLADLTGEKTKPRDILPADKGAAIVLVCDNTFAPVRMFSMTYQAWPVLRAAGYTNVHRLNLWQDKAGGRMRTMDDIRAVVPFSGAPAAGE